MDAGVVMLSLAIAAAGLVIMYFVVRGAILSALAEDRRRQVRPTALQPTHMDEDGL